MTRKYHWRDSLGSLGPAEAEGSHNSFAVMSILVGVVIDGTNYGLHGGSHNILPGHNAPLTGVLDDEAVKTYSDSPVEQVFIGGHPGDDILDLLC